MKNTSVKRITPWTICRPQLREVGKPNLNEKGYSYLPFRRSKHLASLDYIENRGMYKEELSVERGKFPTYNRVLLVHTDGSMSELEAEYFAPPFVVLFQDGSSAFKSIRETKLRQGSEYAEKSTASEIVSSEGSIEEVNHMTEFPYYVPKNLNRRKLEQE
ncbi:hypothetical protein XU18_3467 [Perkinsela sp. CCAP 1560/4]|nr:hypothetical protein XU18_3467 [Perkinsela sp. CCAP 1560/4]|eukprot:KNH05496.1 hypothetical protein XU18_3467 [Perkinsela sp. CCAP 1560/4]